MRSKPYMDGTCERCHKHSGITIMSMFNTQEICTECKDKEEKHPMYSIARDRENDACLGGDFNYIGMGLPPDLK